jgi:hypothetical protein
VNIIRLSDCGRCVEYWRNGSRAYIVPIRGSLADVVGIVCEYSRKWLGSEPTIDSKLQERLDATDAALTRMSFGEEYR